MSRRLAVLLLEYGADPDATCALLINAGGKREYQSYMGSTKREYAGVAGGGRTP